MSLRRAFKSQKSTDSQNSVVGVETKDRPGSLPLIAEVDNAPAKNCRRLVVLGSAKVGKTSIVTRFLDNKYSDKYTPTIEDFHRKIYKIKGEPYRLDILDISGNDPFPAMRRLSLLTGDLFLLVYSIDNRESFEEVKRLQLLIVETKSQQMSSKIGARRPPQLPMVVVGNKTDLENERMIGLSELRALVEPIPCCEFVEASAALDNGIEDIFRHLFNLARLPTEMSPSLHRKVAPGYVSRSQNTGSTRRVTIRRRLSEACGAIAPNPRRPSIRTDLLVLQHRRQVSEDGDSGALRDMGKCSIQ